MFFIVFPKLFPCSVIIFVSLVESRETSESEPSIFRVMNFPKKPPMPSSFITEALPVSPFRPGGELEKF